MGTTRRNDSTSEASRDLERLRSGDQAALARLFALHRDRLRRMVELRMDWRLQARVDASDVLQDAFLDAAARLDGYLRERQPNLPVFLWLRLIVGEALVNLHRHHLGTRMRDPGRELPLKQVSVPAPSSAALASMLLGRLTSPTQAAVRAERLQRLQDALSNLDETDREILTLRHFELLSRAEAAEILGITEEAGAKRYLRALKRLKEILAGMPGGLEGL
jgi:RNA polymerase sigma-70 factor (ECF subfamily)